MEKRLRAGMYELCACGIGSNQVVNYPSTPGNESRRRNHLSPLLRAVGLRILKKNGTILTPFKVFRPYTYPPTDTEVVVFATTISTFTM